MTALLSSLKPRLGFWQIWNISFGFLGIQIGFALQTANISRIFQTLGASIDDLPILWLAGPVTGLLVQPLIGHFSDRTWTRLGRRRPYFLIGGLLTTLSLLLFPSVPFLWMAAATFWVLDASINVAMEPFRAFVGDMLPSEQRTRGYAMQGVFIGAGAVIGSAAPYLFTVLGVSNEAPPGVVPDSVRLAFYLGAFALLAAIVYTILTTREYPPEQLAAFREPPSLFRQEADLKAAAAPFFLQAGAVLLALGLGGSLAIFATKADAQLYVLSVGVALLGAGFLINRWLMGIGKADNFFSHILGDLTAMPMAMRRLAVVQFFSWFALFCMWIYATPAIAEHHYGAAGPGDQGYNDAGNWVGILFGVYNLVAAIYSFVSPAVAQRLGMRLTHALALVCGGAGLVSLFVIRDPLWLILSMVGVGVAWSSILTLPYAMLCDALPANKMGVFMGMFNFFIVIPQIIASGLLGTVLRTFLGGEPILVLVMGGASMLIAAAAVFSIPARRSAGALPGQADPTPAG